MSAFVATVVPWPKNETSLACAAIRTSASLSPSATDCDGSAGVEETFQTAIRPLLSSNRQISVNVPPESTPIRHPIVVSAFCRSAVDNRGRRVQAQPDGALVGP